VSTEDLTPYDREIRKYLMERSYDEGLRSADGTLSGRWRSARSE